MKVRITFDVELPQVKTEEQLKDVAISYFIHQHGSCDEYAPLDLFEQCLTEVIEDGDLAAFLATIDHTITVSNQFIQRVYP
jgi:hypothetical protein